MADKPHWRKSWEPQSSTDHLEASSKPPSSAGSMLPSNTNTTAGLSVTNLRRLPPLHAAFGVSPGANRSPSTHNTLMSNSSGQLAPAYPSPATHYDGPPSHKRRRVGDAQVDGRHTTHAYSSTLLPDGRHLPTHHARSKGQPASGYDKNIDDSSHATRPPHADDEVEIAHDRPANGGVIPAKTWTGCCPLQCMGPGCCSLRSLLADTISEFLCLDMHLQGATAGGPVQSTWHFPDVNQVGSYKALEWVLQGLRRSNADIRSLVGTETEADQRRESHPSATTKRRTSGEFESNISPGGSTAAAVSPDEMKRRRAEAHNRDGQLPRRLAPAVPALPNPDLAEPLTGSSSKGHSQQLSEMAPTSEQVSLPSSRQHPSPLTPAFLQSQMSPMPEPHAQHGPQLRMQPSPAALQFPGARPSHLTTALQMPPSSSAYDHAHGATPVHLQHLQDLQHQVSVKTLALQTLQAEYNSLLAKLERQRTKCATLEKKFEVSDVEINSLTDERERLQARVAILESQAEDLSRGRDDARKEMAESGRQYIRIVEMASKLQAQGVEDRRKWDDERRELMERIRLLEADLSGNDTYNSGGGNNNDNNEEGYSRIGHAQSNIPTNSPVASSNIHSPAMTTNMQMVTPVTSGEAPAAVRDQSNDPPPGPDPVWSEAVSNVSTQNAPSAVATQDVDQVSSLQAEIRRLRSYTERLETSIRSIMEENRSIQEALRAVSLSGERMQEVLAQAMGVSDD